MKPDAVRTIRNNKTGLELTLSEFVMQVLEHNDEVIFEGVLDGDNQVRTFRGWAWELLPLPWEAPTLPGTVIVFHNHSRHFAGIVQTDGEILTLNQSGTVVHHTIEDFTQAVHSQEWIIVETYGAV